MHPDLIGTLIGAVVAALLMGSVQLLLRLRHGRRRPPPPREPRETMGERYRDANRIAAAQIADGHDDVKARR